MSSIFWGKNIEPIGSINDAPDNSALSNSNGASKSKLSNSGFALRFSFNLSESISPLHSQGDEIKGIASRDALIGASEITKRVDEKALSENINLHASKV